MSFLFKKKPPRDPFRELLASTYMFASSVIQKEIDLSQAHILMENQQAAFAHLGEYILIPKIYAYLKTWAGYEQRYFFWRGIYETFGLKSIPPLTVVLMRPKQLEYSHFLYYLEVDCPKVSGFEKYVQKDFIPFADRALGLSLQTVLFVLKKQRSSLNSMESSDLQQFLKIMRGEQLQGRTDFVQAEIRMISYLDIVQKLDKDTVS